jgi:hypothetical protein
MSTYGYFGHDDPAPPVARTPSQRAHACGYPVQALFGENIAAGYPSSQSVFQGWLGSPGHRQNIERASFAAIGVGVAGAGTLNWVQNFGSVADAGATVPPPPPSPPAPAPPPPAAVTPGVSPASALRFVQVRGCHLRSRRTATCRLRLGAPAVVRGRLLRRGRVVARGAVRSESAGHVRPRLEGDRRLKPWRCVLRLRLGDHRVRHVVRLR